MLILKLQYQIRMFFFPFLQHYLRVPYLYAVVSNSINKNGKFLFLFRAPIFRASNGFGDKRKNIIRYSQDQTNNWKGRYYWRFPVPQHATQKKVQIKDVRWTQSFHFIFCIKVNWIIWNVNYLQEKWCNGSSNNKRIRLFPPNE